jgi:hypothetical protein
LPLPASLPAGEPQRSDPSAGELPADDLPAEGTLAAASRPATWSLEALHRSGAEDLLDPDRIGYVTDVNHVAGFESHRFTRLPGSSQEPWRKNWAVTRLELIGLLKYDRPKAYVTEHLPRLDELGEAATRDLDDFESAALPRLRTYEDLVIDEQPRRIRLLGSLRAGVDCLQCHDVQRGELLGCLSYELLPVETPVATAQAAAEQH